MTPMDCGGLPVTCSSAEALELYNKALLAYLSSNEKGQPYGEKALELDGAFPLVHCLLANTFFETSRPPTDPLVARHVEAVRELGSEVTERERAHVKALLANASGDLPGALDVWANILVHHPTDVLAIRLLYRGCIMLGRMERLRNLLSSVMPFWSESMEPFPHILGFYAFSLEENNHFDRAEEVGRRALSLNKKTPWAYHGIAHVMEEDRGPERGIEFLTSSREHWQDSVLAIHLYWHLSLYYLDLGNTDEVLDIFDKHICIESVFTRHNVQAITNNASLLWRLNVLGIEVGEERWRKVEDLFHKNRELHESQFVETQLMMILTRGKVTECAARLALAREMLKSLEDYAKEKRSFSSSLADKIGLPVCNALLAYGKEQYSEVVSLMLPLRYDFVRFGGSWAQRQVYSVTLIQAAIRANQISLALALVSELKAIKPRSEWLSKLFKELKVKIESSKNTLCNYDYRSCPFVLTFFGVNKIPQMFYLIKRYQVHTKIIISVF